MTEHTGRRFLIAVLLVGLVGSVGVVGQSWWSGRTGHVGATSPPVLVATAAVVTTDLATTTELSGTLGYAGSYPLTAQQSGVVTEMPQPGQTIARGMPAYEVDGSPVYLLYGPRPPWRDLMVGVTDGPDVRQLEENLTALGYADVANLTVDDHFDWATGAALRRWQLATGRPVTGQLRQGAVVYEPGPIRVSALSAALGSPVQPGAAVLTATSTTPVVSVPVPAAQAYLVRVGDTVTVTLPAGNVTSGLVRSISATADLPTPSDSNGNSRSGPPTATVPAVVSLSHPAEAAGFDQAPVTVNVTSRAVKHVLAVPITALVALAGGGYGVYQRDGTQRRLVAVTPGLFANSLVQITSGGLRAGDLVEVPVP